MNKKLITSSLAIAMVFAVATPAFADEGRNREGADASVSTSGKIEDRAFFNLGFDLPKFKFDSSGSAEVRREKSGEVRASSTEKRVEKRIEKAAEKADQSIDDRIEKLQKLLERLADSTLPAGTVASISASIDAQIKSLTDLKARIEAGTSTTTIKTLLRGHAFVESKAHVAAAASRVHAVAAQMTEFSQKLQDRITAAQTAGADVSAAVAAMAEFNSDLARAKAEADAAVAATANIQDSTDPAVIEANKAALKDAGTKLANAHKALAEARHDIASIYSVIKGKKGAIKTEATVEAR